MKQSLLFLAFLVLGMAASAQPGLRKVFAYAQGSVPGVRQEVAVIEGGDGQLPPPPPLVEERVTYSLYAEQSGASKVSFSTVWIKGKAYPVKADLVVTPVEWKTNEETGEGKITLAPASKQKVWALSPGTMYKKQPVKTAKLRKLMGGNEVIVVYTYRGSSYYYAVKKIKILPPAIAI